MSRLHADAARSRTHIWIRFAATRARS